MIVKGDARRIPLADNSIQCVVTSPPYWGLRKYAGEQEVIWDEANGCKHLFGDAIRIDYRGSQIGKAATVDAKEAMRGNLCKVCGSWMGAFGLEPTVEMYVQHSVEILREVRRVLRPDGICFWNIGDTYVSHGGTHRAGSYDGYVGRAEMPSQMPNRSKRIPRGSGRWGGGNVTDASLAPKQLCLVPARVALAAQADGWWVRSDIIWNKPNPMPSSVKDRPSASHEHIFMLAKSLKYFWNADAVKEPFRSTSAHRESTPWVQGWAKGDGPHEAVDHAIAKSHRGSKFTHGKKTIIAPNTSQKPRHDSPFGRNLRDVWEFPPQPYHGAHFATFPPELVIRCLQAATRPGDWVLDPFAGSGTVGQVAFNMARRCVLLDRAYQDLQRERVPPMAALLIPHQPGA